MKYLLINIIVLFLSVNNNLAFASETTKNFPEFSLIDLQSNKHLTHSLINVKLTIVDFWASWCEPCKTSLPFFAQLQKKYGPELQIITINVDEDKKDALDFIKANPFQLVVLHDPKNEVGNKVKIEAIPMSFWLNSKKQIVSTHRGFKDADKKKIEKEIQDYLNK